MSQDLKFIASTTVMDPAAGPLSVMVFHVAPAFADEVDEKFDRIKGMGLFVQDPKVVLNPDIDFVRIFHLNRCFTEREVLQELDISLSPILEIVEYTVQDSPQPSQVPDELLPFQIVGASPPQQERSKKILLAISEAPLALRSVYEYDNREYRVTRVLGELLYQVMDKGVVKTHVSES